MSTDISCFMGGLSFLIYLWVTLRNITHIDLCATTHGEV